MQLPKSLHMKLNVMLVGLVPPCVTRVDAGIVSTSSRAAKKEVVFCKKKRDVGEKRPNTFITF